MRQSCFYKIEHRKDIGTKCPLKLLGANLSDTLLGLLLSSVVDQNVEPAKCFNRLFNCLLAKGFFANIAGNQQAATPFLFDLPLGFFSVIVFIQVHNHTISTFFGVHNRYSSANAAIATSNKRNFVAQFATALIIPVFS